MQNEILKPVLDTDEVAVPRYDIVGPNGSVIQQNVELRLKNEVVQEGTPYDEESVLPASLREQLELPQSATPAEAFLRMLKVSGGAVARNRAPQTSDAQPAGKIWIVPKMVFNNQMPNALTQVASNWKCTAATAAVSGNKVTVTGNGGAATLVAEATMLTAAKAADLLYVTANVTVLDDANSVKIELICDNNVVATQSLNVPTGGDTMQLVARAPAGANAVPKLRVTSTYNTASAQSGKRVSVEAITVWNLTADMCQIEAGIEFTRDEATAYLAQYGVFQTREYEYSMWWWHCHGKIDNQYVWEQGLDFYRRATAEEAQAGTDNTKWMSPAAVRAWWDAFYNTLTMPVVRGGTGKASWSANRLVYPSAAQTMAQLAFPSVAGSVLRQDASGAPYWTSPEDLRNVLHTLGLSRVVYGSYTGTGTAGSSNPTSLTFPFAVKLLVIMHRDNVSFNYYRSGQADFVMLVQGITAFRTQEASDNASDTRNAVTWSNDYKTVSWYHANSTPYAGGQMNTRSAVYLYVAIG